jgi:hypothetical protein
MLLRKVWEFYAPQAYENMLLCQQEKGRFSHAQNAEHGPNKNVLLFR